MAISTFTCFERALLAALAAIGGFLAAADAVSAQALPRIYYEVDGRGPAVVFIEGWAHDTTTWFRLLPLLRPGRQLVRYDLRGQGRSEAPADADYSLDAHVEDLFRVLDALQIERPHLVASTLGARVAIAAAVDAPERIASLTLIDPHLAWTSDELDWWARFLTAYARVGRPSLAEYAAVLVNHWFGAGFMAQEPWVVALYDLVLRRQSSEALVDGIRAWLATDLTIVASERVEIPVLLIEVGRMGGILGEGRLRSTFPKTRGLLLPDSGELPQLDDPEGVGKALASVLPATP